MKFLKGCEMYPEDNSEIRECRQKKGSLLGRLVKIFFIGIMIILNVFLVLILAGIISLFATSRQDMYIENVIVPGPETDKLVVINLCGVIGNEMSYDIKEQIDLAREDDNVRGIIFRVNSPGGMVSSSDQIYNEIRKYRMETNEPAVAFMQSVAASGGYYVSAACDSIVAEPTAITGSIGVIMGYFVFQNLLEEKLGIQPVIIKSGLKKDWPSSFQAPTEEQQRYLEEKIIEPSFTRFVEIVAEGRPDLTIDSVRRLADGSIYPAQEALDEYLIDSIGYLDTAIDELKQLAGLEEALVVEYERPFSLSEFLRSEAISPLKITKAKLYEFTTPEVMYLWRAF